MIKSKGAYVAGVTRQNSFGAYIVCSFIFHILIFAGGPLLSLVVWSHKEFEHPKTFELVSSRFMQQMNMKQALPLPVVKKSATVKKNSTPVPAKNKKIQDPSESKEELQALENLLDDSEKQPVSSIGSIGNFPYDWYLRNIELKVEQFWKPPLDNPNLFVVVSFFIFGNGTISDVTISRSSGNAMVDNLAIYAIKQAAPFGKLPPRYNQDRLEINHTLRATVK